MTNDEIRMTNQISNFNIQTRRLRLGDARLDHWCLELDSPFVIFPHSLLWRIGELVSFKSMIVKKNANFPATLWDLIKPIRRLIQRSRQKPPAKVPAALRTISARQQRYDQIVLEMKHRHGIRVRKWRSGTTGCAWQVSYSDGRIVRWIESPYPRGPMSAAVFLHEVGHHAIGFNRYKPRCLEEYMAWQWAMKAMTELGLEIPEKVHRRVELSLRYAVAKARRRGLRKLPLELIKYC